MDKYSMYGECPICTSTYSKTNPMVECKDENGNTVRACTYCYECYYKNKFGNADDSEDLFYHERKRLDTNKKILQIIQKYCEDFPNQRFHQALQNLGITSREMHDKWYEESECTLKQLQESLKQLQELLNDTNFDGPDLHDADAKNLEA